MGITEKVGVHVTRFKNLEIRLNHLS